MKDVLRHIFEKKKAYQQLPLFGWMRNERLPPAARLAFYPCMAHFILTFGDLNKFVLREKQAADAYQEMVNNHTLEDDHHWPWYLEDFAKLGYDTLLPPTEWMRFLWGEETKENRILSARLTGLVKDTSGLERLVIIEAIEETGNVLFATMLPIAQAIEQELGIELRYCGAFHFERESGHAANADHSTLARAKVTDAERDRYVRSVDQVFSAFEAWTHELLRYALAHPAPVRARGTKAPSRSATWAVAELNPELGETRRSKSG